jgi:hypothetical protein
MAGVVVCVVAVVATHTFPGAVISNYIVYSIVSSKGIMYVALVERYQCKKWLAAFTFALSSAMSYFLGARWVACGAHTPFAAPIFTALCDAFGVRIVVVVGGVLLSLASLISGFATHVHVQSCVCATYTLCPNRLTSPLHIT